MGMHFYMVQELFTEISALVERYDINLSNSLLMWLNETRLNIYNTGERSPPLIVCGVVLNFSRALVILQHFCR